MRIWKPIFAIFMLFFMLGCSAISGFSSKLPEVIAAIEEMHDVQALAYIKVPCAIDIGAYYRVLVPRERDAVTALCWPGMGDR